MKYRYIMHTAIRYIIWESWKICVVFLCERQKKRKRNDELLFFYRILKKCYPQQRIILNIWRSETRAKCHTCWESSHRRKTILRKSRKHMSRKKEKNVHINSHDASNQEKLVCRFSITLATWINFNWNISEIFIYVCAEKRDTLRNIYLFIRYRVSGKSLRSLITNFN